MSSVELETPAAPDTFTSADLSRPVFFPVSVTKLVVMATLTCGIYEIYWFYRNWRLVKQNEKSNIVPVLRTIFGIFFCYALFERVKEEADDLKLKPLPAGALAAVWILFTLFSMAHDPYWLIAFVAPVFLIPVQKAVNEINHQLAPDHDPNDRYSAWNIVAMVIGSIMWVLVLLGLFVIPD